MVDKELLYDKCEELLELLETLRDIEIDDDYFKLTLEKIERDLNYSIDRTNAMIDNEIVGPKK